MRTESYTAAAVVAKEQELVAPDNLVVDFMAFRRAVYALAPEL